MSNVVNLKKAKRKRAEHQTFCDAGFHKWMTLTERRFDVKEGKLISAERCKRCGRERTRLS